VRRLLEDGHFLPPNQLEDPIKNDSSQWAFELSVAGMDVFSLNSFQEENIHRIDMASHHL